MAKLMAEVVSKVPDAQVMADLDGAVQWAAANGGDAARVGITGFCWGGRITWLYAAHGPVKAGVAWYGRLVGQASALTPQPPVDVAGRLNAWGFAVRGYDQHGHGNSAGARGALPDDDRLLSDLAAVIDDTRQHMGPRRPLILLGHSMGGLVAARAVSLGLRPVEGLVLSSPALDAGMGAPLRALVQVLAGWAVWLGHIAAWLGLPLSMALLTVLQIRPEERILAERFGAEFERYAARVRRWL